MYAAGYGADDALRVLLAHGASPNGAYYRTVTSWAGQTALHWTTDGPHVGRGAAPRRGRDRRRPGRPLARDAARLGAPRVGE